MTKLLSDIIDKWKNASVGYLGEVSFMVMWTSTAEEFIHLLETWEVPFQMYTDHLYMYITTLSYWYVMQNKKYYSDSGITAEMEASYYA